MNDSIDQSRKNRRTTLLLAGLVLGMFGFGFAMVPLYGFLCQVTGTQSVEVRGDLGNAPQTAAASTPTSWKDASSFPGSTADLRPPSTTLSTSSCSSTNMSE